KVMNEGVQPVVPANPTASEYTETINYGLKLASALGVVSGDQKAWGRQWRITEGSGNVGDLIGVGNFTKNFAALKANGASTQQVMNEGVQPVDQIGRASCREREKINYGVKLASEKGVVSGDQKAWGRQWRITEGSGTVGDLIGVGNFTKN